MERHNRFFVEDLSGQTVALSVSEAHHAVHVMRMGVGSAVELFDGRGGRAGGAIAEAKHGKVLVRIADRVSAGPRPGPAIHLAFAAAKGNRLDWLLEKATELAATSLTPVRFERSVAEPGELTGAKRERWVNHCVAAAKQSGLDWLPELSSQKPLADFLADFQASGAAGLLGSAGPDAQPLACALAAVPVERELCLLVGPEGGLTEAEELAARQAGFVPARLGQTVLRTETAALALLAVSAAMRR